MVIFKQKIQYGVCDVDMMYRFYFKYLLGKLHEIFKWNNLPDTIDETFLNNCLFLTGKVCWTNQMKDGELRILYGNSGGKPDCYYSPTIFTVSNPILGDKDLVIENDKDAVMMYNTRDDKLYEFLPSTSGLFGLIHQTATLLADNIVSISCAQINSRVQAVAVTDDQNVKNSAEVALKELYAGKPWTVATETLLNSIKINPLANSTSASAITTLIELHQYIIADFYNSIGIKTNPVNKKERLITDEINSVDNYLAVTLDQMLKARQEAVERINNKFGTSISVEITEELKDVVNPEESMPSEDDTSSKEVETND